MAISFTPEQQKVIDLRGRNILVSAAAGSGKTAVLVERILQMICDEKHPVDIDRLLVVTFTNAAAAEMRERISLGIARQLALHPGSTHLERQSTLLHNAQITTIDSFCMFLLKNHFQEIGVDPAFRVMDEGERKLLEQDVMREMLEDRFARQKEESGTSTAFWDCVEYFCPGGRESVLEEYISGLNRFAESQPWPEEWLEERKQDYQKWTEEELEETGFGLYLKSHIRKMLEGCLETYRQMQEICQEEDGPYMYGELVDQELEQLEHLLRQQTLAEYARWLPAFSFGRLSSKKDESVSVWKRELVKKLRSQMKDTLSDLGDRFFAAPLSQAVVWAEECAGPVRTLVELSLEYRDRLRERKRQDKVVDFSDMEHFALDILLTREEGNIRPSQVALEYRQYFHEILIDEYQDSNLVQEYLLRAISGEEEGHYNRFMVGDVKQSIYKFRLARPELFLEKYEVYTQADGACQRIDLSRNFRSRRQVVDTVNGIFRRIMSRQVGGIEYDGQAALYPGASYPENPGCESELILVEKPAASNMTVKQAEALAIAGRIRSLHAHFQVTDKESGQLRPARYRDMVILLRTNSGWDEEFKEVLEDQGIPVYISSKTGYFAASEVQELLQVLRTLDNPRQEIPLFGVMKSYFGGFTEEEIARIRSMDKKKPLIQVLEDLAAQAKAREEAQAEIREEAQAEIREEGWEEAQAEIRDEAREEAQSAGAALEGTRLDPGLLRKISDFLAWIRRCRELTVYLPIRELLQRIVSDTGYLDYVSALPAGSRRRANVEMLFTKASDFEKTSYHGLFHFVRYIEQLEKYDVDYGEAELLDENADVVRIMSIHKSKGLEFPITFVCGLAKRFNMQDTNQSLIVDMDLGIGADYVDVRRRLRGRTLRRQVLARKMREDNLSEELRVLYVALTRPREKLIMTAALENAAARWEEQLKEEHLTYPEFIRSSSYLDFLLPVAANAGVEVRFATPEELTAEEDREQIQLWEKRQRLLTAGAFADPAALQTLRERFAWRYPMEKLEKLYTKTTVSELKLAAMAQKDEPAYHAFEEPEVIPYIPRFMREQEPIGGAARGNAYHKAMQLLDYGRVYEGILTPHDMSDAAAASLSGKDAFSLLLQNVREQLDEAAASHRLSAEYRQVVSEYPLARFLTTKLAFRIWRAHCRGTLYREQPFVYGISAARLGKELPAEEKVLIQGIVDLYFIEDAQLVLVDYKTDLVSDAETLWNRYETQLQYYEEALCHLRALPMKEKILYSFHLGRCVEASGKP